MGFRRILTTLAERFDLPADIAAGLPRIELDGDGACTLDRHHGILAYHTEQIVIALNIGTLTVEGSGLELRRMHREQLRITGRIRCITFGGDGSCGG